MSLQTAKRKGGRSLGTAIGFLTLLLCQVYQVQGNNGDQKGTFSEEFDYIVVGAGTAGCAVASRLSERKNVSVLLLEIGQIPHAWLDYPSRVPEALRVSGDTHVYESIPQENAGLLRGGAISYMVGRTMGGSSAVNGMMYNRGSAYDYDNWAETTKDPSWSYASLLKYFRRMEDYQGDFPSDVQHGTGGPITISRLKYSPAREEWLQAGQHLGYDISGDPNGPQRVGFTVSEFTKKFGRRISSFTGYIKPFLGRRKNLKVIINAAVKRVVFRGNVAQGVIYTRDGKPSQLFARARREVILSAGVMGSPEILLKSGIGPRNALTAAGVPIVKTLPVGNNLQDHVGLHLYFTVNNSMAAFVRERDLNPQTLAFYNRYGDGPYSYQVLHSQASISTGVATSWGNRPGTWADVMIYYSAHDFGEEDIPSFGGGKEADIPLDPHEAVVSVLILLTRPKSQGRVTLNSTDPLNSDPVIDFQYYRNPDDFEAVLESIYLSLKIFEETPGFQRLGARYATPPLTSCGRIAFRSDGYWRCFIQQTTVSGLHGGGTCKMGRGEEDPTAVVDSQLRVLGVKGLRVVDNSIMPAVTNGNTQAPAYVIGEKAADLILSQF